jgi:hypothetical protein
MELISPRKDARISARPHGTDAATQKDWESKYKEIADAILKKKGWK